MASSQKRIDACRRHGAKGGPKTPEGIAVWKLTSLKHGLTSSVVVHPDLHDEVVAEISIFSKKLDPRGDLETSLVEKAAVAGVQTNRCHAQAEAAAKKREREAIPLWDRARADAVL